MIRSVCIDDAKQICNIYNYYIENTVITFEETVVPLYEMKQRITDITESLPWFVYEDNNEVLGYSYASKWKGRCAYRYSVETTVYLHNKHCGQGIGSALYYELLNDLKSKNIHAAIAGIALPNEGSRKLHEKLGFKKTAHFSEVGYKFDKWIDVGYWQLVLPTA